MVITCDCLYIVMLFICLKPLQGFGSHAAAASTPGAMVQLVQPGFQPFATTVPGIQLNRKPHFRWIIDE